MTKLFLTFIATITIACFGSGCATHMSDRYSAREPADILAAEGAAEPTQRMLVKQAALTLQVEEVRPVVKGIESIIRTGKGYIESSILNSTRSATVTLRIPVNELEQITDSISELGDEKSRYVTADDVTDTVIDLEARLKNKKALRDRLRILLSKAHSVKDVLTVEAQLTRIQSEIDSMEGLLESYKSRAAMSQLTVQIKQKRILGPIAYAGKGLGWCIEKLFVIR